MDHDFWTRHIGRWGFYLHRYQRHVHYRMKVVRHRDAENIMLYGPVLVVHLFWRRWQLSIDRKRADDDAARRAAGTGEDADGR